MVTTISDIGAVVVNAKTFVPRRWRLLNVLRKHLSASDLESVQAIVAEIEARI